MAGYRGFSMSNNAVDAYNSGEKPFSKWTKSEILNEIESLNVKTFELFKKMKVKTLKNNFLYKSSWHHSSKFYNEVDFYSVDIDKIESVSEKELNELLNASVKKKRKKKLLAKSLCKFGAEQETIRK
jgi:hypothetical protein